MPEATHAWWVAQDGGIRGNQKSNVNKNDKKQGRGGYAVDDQKIGREDPILDDHLCLSRHR